ncbi:DUF1345 domain-containing protein [Acidisoma cellulosilytica]|uniref:DUF1345 domain-containing protein n=1 Tax=Acidisoma cellulosilyticum TaxID=2802395 RepID=A0A963YWV7_9PROT|nr:DUF1345 domain-containing protein [Acidisoma cellulosilyticum]MCB8878599.1 DUF1345 domain-containing protein [Acidisoma cellulosilyticum]
MKQLPLFLTSRIQLGAAVIAGLAAALLLPRGFIKAEAGGQGHLVLSWDIGALVLLVLWGITMVRTSPIDMPARAKAQQAGEWTVFTISLAAIVASVLVVVIEFKNISSLKGETKAFHLALVIVTLILSWLTMQLIFALRYAHEFYSYSDGSDAMDGGLDFPHEPEPDYLDFLYFAMVLGMTFQVSDVDITARKIRRLATLHGFVGFTFNTVILALTVNIAAGLL